MIKKLICLLFGHKNIHKAYTGNKMDVNNGFINTEVMFFKYIKTPFCIRCGKNID